MEFVVKSKNTSDGSFMFLRWWQWSKRIKAWEGQWGTCAPTGRHDILDTSAESSGATVKHAQHALCGLSNTIPKGHATGNHCGTLVLLFFAFFLFLWRPVSCFRPLLLRCCRPLRLKAIRLHPQWLQLLFCAFTVNTLDQTYAQIRSSAADLFFPSTVKALQPVDLYAWHKRFCKTALGKHHKSLQHGEPVFASAWKSVIPCFPCKNMHASCRTRHVWFFLVQRCESHY